MGRQIRTAESLKSWTDAELCERLEGEVAEYNRRRRLGLVSDWQFGQMLQIEERCRLLGDEIKRRRRD